jgi:hypothetical protein
MLASADAVESRGLASDRVSFSFSCLPEKSARMLPTWSA